MTDPSISVREATERAVVDVLRILDAAMLAIDHDTVATAIERGDVLVAVDGGNERIVGAVVLSPHGDSPEDGAHVEAIAVQRERRNRGIGRRLIDAARDRNARLTTDFRRELEPFWRSLGFTVRKRATRCWGECGTDTAR